MKEKISNFFNEWYGRDEPQDRGILWAASIMMLFSFVFFIIVLFSKQEASVFIRLVIIYIIAFTTSVSLFIFAAYFFQDKKTASKCKLLKFAFLVITLILIAITFLPVTIFMGILNITKFYNIWRYYTIYAISFIVTLLGSIFLWTIIFFVASKFHYINPIVMATFIAFIGNYGMTKIIFYCHFNFNKKRIKKKLLNGKITEEQCSVQMDRCINDYEQSKKEIYIFTFLVVTIVAIATTCINWDLIIVLAETEKINEVTEGVSSAFALFIAFDRLYDKWKKTHIKPKNICESCSNYVAKADD